MIRLGYASDKDNALALCKQTQDGQFAAGFVLAGFGTLPMPGEICDNAVHRVVQYTACNLQKVLDALLEKNCTQMDVAKDVISRYMKLINKGVRYFNINVGQGVYVAGSICYVAGEQFISLPFGGGSVQLCHGTHIKSFANLALSDRADPKYIWDAIGGSVEWDAVFDEGILPVGAQLICSTQAPTEELLQTTVNSLIHTNQAAFADIVHNNLERKEMPLAVLVIAQMAGSIKKGESDDDQTAS